MISGGLDFNVSVLSLNNPDLRLDFGMTCREAARRARNWWDNTGASEMRLHLMRQAEPVGSSNSGNGAPLATRNPDDPNFLPSGIIAGAAWDDLTAGEQVRLVATWAEFHGRAAWKREKPWRWGDTLPSDK